ncbi:MAG: NAD-dependent epimerase/dehydratase family protein, partial [Opitutae bacterium]|nr:NAD-dependent epimerase/dehydratase family protein [Opitutae bacterium]
NMRALAFSDYLEKDEFRPRLAAGGFDGARIEGVVHMGACSATTERDASYLADNNFLATRELAEYCLGRGIRFLYASSCATYGDGSCGIAPHLQAHRTRPLIMALTGIQAPIQLILVVEVAHRHRHFPQLHHRR